MISETESHFGALLARTAQEIGAAVEIEICERLSGGLFIVGRKAGLYAKYSTSRMSPWTFTVTRDQFARATSLESRVGAVCVCLVCASDGIAAIPLAEVAPLLWAPGAPGAQATLSASRRPRHQYLIRGSQGVLDRRISEADLGAWLRRHATND